MWWYVSNYLCRKSRRDIFRCVNMHMPLGANIVPLFTLITSLGGCTLIVYSYSFDLPTPALPAGLPHPQPISPQAGADWLIVHPLVATLAALIICVYHLFAFVSNLHYMRCLNMENILTKILNRIYICEAIYKYV